MTSREWTTEEFETEFEINLAEEMEADDGIAQYWSLPDGRFLEIVKASSIVKIDLEVVGELIEEAS